MTITITKVKKWGNALAIHLPKETTERFGLTDGSLVKLASEFSTIVIQPMKKFIVPSLHKLVENITPTNRPKLINWGKMRGREVW